MSVAKPGKKLRLLFAAYMAGGNATILQNLEDAIAGGRRGFGLAPYRDGPGEPRLDSRPRDA